jgi:hypothetical protein
MLELQWYTDASLRYYLSLTWITLFAVSEVFFWIALRVESTGSLTDVEQTDNFVKV